MRQNFRSARQLRLPLQKVARLLSFLAIVLLSDLAIAGSVSIPRDTTIRPASDLVNDQGETYELADLVRRARAGQDLSRLEPRPNKLFAPAATVPPLTQVNLDEIGGEIAFGNVEARPRLTLMAQVRDPASGQTFRLSLSRYMHGTLMRAELLRRLGYRMPATRYFPRLKIKFRSAAALNAFITAAQKATGTDVADRNWLLNKDEVNFVAEFSHVMLESVDSDRFDSHWGFAPNPRIESQKQMVEDFSRYRAYRALIIPYALLDLPGSINKFSPVFAAIFGGAIVITHPFAEGFYRCSAEDARWLLRKMGQLKAEDWKAIVAAGALPKEIDQIVHEKLISRLQNAYELFDLRPDVILPRPNLDLTTPSGLVVKGRVTQKRVDGYPFAYAADEPTSPYQDGDLRRYLTITTYSSALGEALARANEKLQGRSVQDLAAKRQDEIRNRIIEHIRTKPDQPLYQNVEGWGGWINGLALDARRFVSTGTYFESTAPVQLIDTVTATGYIGWFHALDGVKNVVPTGVGNLSLSRTYSHVRPIDTIKQGSKVSWRDLYVPGLMKDLGRVLKGEEVERFQEEGTSDDAKKQMAKRRPLDQFLAQLREGEVFSITDTVGLGANLSVSGRMSDLLGFSPLSFLNSLALGIDATRVSLTQTTFSRTGNGLQITIRSQESLLGGVQFDANYFLNILRLRAQRQGTELTTDAFLIDYNPAIRELAREQGGTSTSEDNQSSVDDINVNPFASRRGQVVANSNVVCPENRKPKDAEEEKACQRKQDHDNLELALGSLFLDNDTDLLYENFSHRKFKLKHDLLTPETQMKLLAMKAATFTEDHTARIEYPKPRDERFKDINPEDEAITLFAHRRGELIGRDLLGLIMDVVDGFLGQAKAKSTLARDSNPNPANTPYGRAYWRIVRAESDLTANYKDPKNRLAPMAAVQHVWGGWQLRQKDFFRLADELNNRFLRTNLVTYPVIDKREFQQMSSIDFYRVTANLSVIRGGIDRIRELILQPQSRGEPTSFQQKRLFSQIVGAFKSTPATQRGDKEMLQEFFTILGDGSSQYGEAIYQQGCVDEKAQKASGEAGPPAHNGAWLYGVYYECLSSWLEELLKLSRRFPADVKGQTRWLAEVLAVLDQYIPMGSLVRYLGPNNSFFIVRVNGFRVKDEKGNLEFFGNTVNEPADSFDETNGIMQFWARKTGLLPMEVERSQGSFR